MPSLHCKVVTPTGTLFDEKAASLRAPGFTGGFGVLPRHAPYLVRLQEGPLVLQDEEGGECFHLEVESGYCLVARDECTILVEKVKD